jgi:hypothetical protein
MNKDLAQVDVASPADAEQLRLASGREVPWHQPKPRSNVPSLAEGSSVADSRDDGGGDNRPEACDLPDACSSRIRRGDPF